MRNEEWLTGGTYGINNVARPSLFGYSLESNLSYYYLVLGATVVMGLLLLGLLRSPWGKAFTALRDNPIRAESLGIDTRAYTLLSFAIGAAYAGIAGALLAQTTAIASLDLFDFHRSADVMLMLIIGGAGYLYGGVIGSAAFLALKNGIAEQTPEYWEFWIGLGLVILVQVGRDRIAAHMTRALPFLAQKGPAS